MSIAQLRAEWENPAYLVTRIDGPDAAVAAALGARGDMSPDFEDPSLAWIDGVLGLPHPSDVAGSVTALEWDLAGAAALLEAGEAADALVVDWGSSVPESCEDAVFYAAADVTSAPDCTWAASGLAFASSCTACDPRDESDWSPRQLRAGATVAVAYTDTPSPAMVPRIDQLVYGTTLDAAPDYATLAWSATPLVPSPVVWLGAPRARVLDPGAVPIKEVP